jgi:tetratricopeptide (TPR) repeat protein
MSDAKWMRHGESLATVQFAAELYRYASHHLLQTRRPEQALELIEKSKALWPENPSLEIDRLGVLYEGLGRHEKGVKGYEKLYVSHPSPEIKTRALMGMMHHLQNVSRHEDALAGLRVAYKIAPKYLQSSVLSAMSSSYRTLRRFDEALATQELATVLEGEADDYSNLAIFYKNAGKLGDAIRCLKKSLGMNPESWNTRLILAGYLYRAGKEKEGEAMFKTVEKPRVGEEFYYTNLAWFYGSIGKKKEFLEALDKALSLYKTPGILNYIKTEVDFDKFREDPAFKALVEKHRARLLSAR